MSQDNFFNTIAKKIKNTANVSGVVAIAIIKAAAIKRKREFFV